MFFSNWKIVEVSIVCRLYIHHANVHYISLSVIHSLHCIRSPIILRSNGKNRLLCFFMARNKFKR